MNSRWMLPVVILALFSLSPAVAQPAPVARGGVVSPPVIVVPPAAQPSEHFDVEAATNAYLAQIPAAAKSRSDAYFEGGYWLVLWDFVYGVVVALILLHFRWSASMRDRAERITRRKPLQTFLYWVQYLAVTVVLSFPLTWYEGFFREHQYGLATQAFGPWMGDQVKDFLLTLVIGGLLIVLLVGMARRLPRTWHLWGALVSVIFLVIGAMIAPVFIFPLFNKITRLDDPKVTAPILRLARANGIPVKDVFQIDASRQSTRMSGNVSGFGSTMRITLNDNLLRRGSPEEIQAVMGHEMGHYVLNHVYKGVLFYLVVIVGEFLLLRWALEWSIARWGEKWQIRSLVDTAALPLVFMIIGVFFFVLTPFLNTQTRTAEQEADMYGLNASRAPDGFAQAAIHLGEYRKMSPGPIEEWIFYDHPSGRNRILGAMRWKKENLRLFSVVPRVVAPTPVAR